MKKSLLFAATALAMLASCSQNDDLAQAPALDKQGQTAVTFGTYMGKAPITRAGQTGSITESGTQTLKSANVGFGVFAYYTDGTAYTANQTTFKPDFMYNEHISWNESGTGASKWEYSPIKYWPNEFASTAVDNSDPAATGEGQHGLVSFFAYAPYVSAGSGETGITALTASSVAGDPKVTYAMAKDGAIVDLLWGTTGTTNGSTAVGSTAQTGTTLSDGTVTKRDGTTHYYVNADLNKMKTQGKVDFLFKHTLAKVGGSQTTNTGNVKNGLMVILDVNKVGTEITGENKDDNTKVTIKDIKIECKQMDLDTDGDGTADLTNKMVNSGTFNLATGKWTFAASDYADPSDDVKYTHTISSPASAATGNATIATTLAEPTAINGTWANIPAGVLSTTATNVYNAETNPMVFFPGTKPTLEFTITYIVRTQDNKLEKGWSEVEQTIKKTVTFTEFVKLNCQYNLLMHLGITGVKFTATVSEWDVDNTDTGEDNVSDTRVEVNLPLNVSE